MANIGTFYNQKFYERRLDVPVETVRASLSSVRKKLRTQGIVSVEQKDTLTDFSLFDGQYHFLLDHANKTLIARQTSVLPGQDARLLVNAGIGVVDCTDSTIKKSESYFHFPFFVGKYDMWGAIATHMNTVVEASFKAELQTRGVNTDEMLMLSAGWHLGQFRDEKRIELLRQPEVREKINQLATVNDELVAPGGRRHYNLNLKQEKYINGLVNDLSPCRKRSAFTKMLMMLLNTSYGGQRNFQAAEKIAAAKLWKCLDPEITAIGMRCKQNQFSSLDYTLIWQNLAEVKKLMATTPGLIPFWLAWENKEMKAADRLLVSSTGSQIAGENSLVRENIVKDLKDYLTNSYRVSKKGWRHLCQLPPLWARQLVVHFGFPQQWTIDAQDDWIDAQPAQIVQPVQYMPPMPNVPITQVQEFLTQKKTGFDFRLTSSLDGFCDIGVRPKFTTFKMFVRNFDTTINNDSHLSMFRVAFKESLKRPAKTFWQEVGLVKDWLARGVFVEESSRGTPVTLDANQKKCDWSWFVARQNAWHEEFLRRQNEEAVRDQARYAAQALEWERLRNERERIRQEQIEAIAGGDFQAHVLPQLPMTEESTADWESDLDEMELDLNGTKYRITPLVSAVALREEGLAMHHCIGGYSDICQNGNSRIFSIKVEDKGAGDFKRAATLQINTQKTALWFFNDGKWKPNLSTAVGTRIKIKDGEEVGIESPFWTMLQIHGPCNDRDKPLSDDVRTVGDMVAILYGRAVVEKKFAKEKT